MSATDVVARAAPEACPVLPEMEVCEVAEARGYGVHDGV